MMYEATITIRFEAPDEAVAWAEAEAFAFKHDGGTVMLVTEVPPPDDEPAPCGYCGGFHDERFCPNVKH